MDLAAARGDCELPRSATIPRRQRFVPAGPCNRQRTSHGAARRSLPIGPRQTVSRHRAARASLRSYGDRDQNVRGYAHGILDGKDKGRAPLKRDEYSITLLRFSVSSDTSLARSQEQRAMAAEVTERPYRSISAGWPSTYLNVGFAALDVTFGERFTSAQTRSRSNQQYPTDASAETISSVPADYCSGDITSARSPPRGIRSAAPVCDRLIDCGFPSERAGPE